MQIDNIINHCLPVRKIPIYTLQYRMVTLQFGKKVAELYVSSPSPPRLKADYESVTRHITTCRFSAPSDRQA